MSNRQQAETFRELHSAGVLVLPNAWDAGSAAIIAAAGAKAIATTSAGVAWAVGKPDGQGLVLDEVVEQVRRVVSVVDVPVTADVEGGYDDVAATVAAVAEVGAVGINLEDSRAPGGPLFTPEEQAERIAVARAAAPDVFINARSDVFLFQIGSADERVPDALNRAKIYAEAGADGLFVPGLLDLAQLAEVVRGTSLPVNAMAFPGAPSVAEYASVGVRRVSLGSSIAQAAYGLASRAAVEALTLGTYTSVAESADYGTLNGLFR